MEQKPERTQDRARGKVLIVDDDDALVVPIVRVLETAGFDVTVANSGRRASRKLELENFDVILSDIHMPGLDGIQLLRLIRTRDLEVPVLLMTGKPELSTATEAVALGALQYLTKPVSLSELKTAVMRANRLGHIARLKRDAFKLVHGDKGGALDLVEVETKLERALDSLWMAYQPIVHARTQRLFAHEALLRTRDQQLPNPVALIDAAERVGRLNDVGRKVRRAVAAVAASAPLGSLLFVNLHPHDLLDEDLYSAGSLLTPFASRVVLEITERTSLNDIADVRGRVARLRKLGYRIAVDDLGAGYSGLTTFASLEPEFVKIDMSLVRDVDTQPLKQKLIGALSSICGEVDSSVIAEGVETDAERHMLIELGCPLLQGYLTGRPAAEFAAVGA